jgi:hypothetical protein
MKKTRGQKSRDTLPLRLFWTGVSWCYLGHLCFGLHIPGQMNVCSCLDHAGLVSVGPILDAYVLDSISSIFLGRSINALVGSPDGLTLVASTKFIENHLLR